MNNVILLFGLLCSCITMSGCIQPRRATNAHDAVRRMVRTKCSICHGAPQPNMLSRSEATRILQQHSSRFELGDKETLVLIRYLSK